MMFIYENKDIRYGITSDDDDDEIEVLGMKMISER